MDAAYSSRRFSHAVVGCLIGLGGVIGFGLRVGTSSTKSGGATVFGEGGSEAFEDAAVVYEQAVVFAFGDAVCAGDGLHQGVAAHGFVDVEGSEARNIEAGEPHGADNGEAERMLAVAKVGF